METIRESSLAVMLLSGCVENSCFQKSMARMPAMVPVSYLEHTSQYVVLQGNDINVNIPEQYTTEGNEKTNDDGRPCRTCRAWRRLERYFDHDD
jgi:hypothetical protein